ncbi:MAG: hypothetical protein V4548_08820 [Bacteroidota bacterium]
MALYNLGLNHITDADLNILNNALETANNVLNNYVFNLTKSDKKKLCKVKEQNKMLINRVQEFRIASPALQSPEVNWVEFEKDYENRLQTEQLLSKIKAMEDVLLDIKALNDHDNYTDALRDYHYTKYKKQYSNEGGFEPKYDALKIYFPNSGRTKKSVK